MADMSLCSSVLCLQRDSCSRALTIPKEFYQSYYCYYEVNKPCAKYIKQESELIPNREHV